VWNMLSRWGGGISVTVMCGEHFLDIFGDILANIDLTVATGAKKKRQRRACLPRVVMILIGSCG
jgi:hypothetical protein